MTCRKNNSIIKVNKEVELKQLDQSDTEDIFHTIDTQREYLGKWLPFVEFTKEVSDTERSTFKTGLWSRKHNAGK